jgi:hypothetical protein
VHARIIFQILLREFEILPLRGTSHRASGLTMRTEPPFSCMVVRNTVRHLTQSTEADAPWNSAYHGAVIREEGEFDFDSLVSPVRISKFPSNMMAELI